MNSDIKEKIKKEGLSQWQIAEQLGVSEWTLCRYLRHELTGKRYQEIMNAINVLKAKEEMKNAGSKSQLG